MAAGHRIHRPSPHEVAESLIESASRFCDLIPMVTDESATTPFVPAWTAGEIVRHVTYLPGYYTQIARGEARLAERATDMGAVNAENMATLADMPLSECSDRIDAGIRSLAETIASSPDDADPVAFHAGALATPAELCEIALGEYEIHGLDLASTMDACWSTTPRSAAACLLTAVPAAAQWVDTDAAVGHSGTYEIRLRKGLGAIRLEFDDGHLTARPEPSREPRPQTIIGADPVAFLRVFYGRQSQWSAIARGQLVARGRKPWKALSLRSKFLPV